MVNYFIVCASPDEIQESSYFAITTTLISTSSSLLKRKCCASGTWWVNFASSSKYGDEYLTPNFLQFLRHSRWLIAQIPQIIEFSWLRTFICCVYCDEEKFCSFIYLFDLCPYGCPRNAILHREKHVIALGRNHIIRRCGDSNRVIASSSRDRRRHCELEQPLTHCQWMRHKWRA